MSDGEEPKTIEDGVEEVTEHINASGHVQELKRNFGLLSVCSVGLVTGNTWPAIGGSVIVALYNGGAPGVIYELLAVSFFYWCIAACVAELASSVPSSAGVYHWASITAGPKYGPICGWFAAWWNFLAWIFGGASISAICANSVLAMAQVFHPEFVPKQWHTFVLYIVFTWLCCFTAMFANRALPTINKVGLFFILGGVFITILVCAIMPSRTGAGYASSSTVWQGWQNGTGWNSNGLVFMAGMLNGAYAVGTPDCITHLGEEIPDPRRNMPKAIAAQMSIGLVTAFLYLVAIFYSVNSVDNLLSSTYISPLAEVYLQATGSPSGSIGLLFLVMACMAFNLLGIYIIASRILWTLARDHVTPIPAWLSRINRRHGNPFNAILLCGVIITILGCIYLGSTTAFAAFVGAFVVLSDLSYVAAILPHLLSRRAHVRPGPFWMPAPVFYTLATIGCAYVFVFMVIYCFPFAQPVTAANMNYSSLIMGGFTLFAAAWYLWKRRDGYVGPKVMYVERTVVTVEDEAPVRFVEREKA